MSRSKEHDKSTFLTQQGGTPHYMAPELFNSMRVSEKCDVYSLGCIMYEALSGKQPFRELMGGDGVQFLIRISRAVADHGQRPDLSGVACPPEMARLIQDCWAQDPHQRPECSQVMDRLQCLLHKEDGTAPPAPGLPLLPVPRLVSTGVVDPSKHAIPEERQGEEQGEEGQARAVLDAVQEEGRAGRGAQQRQGQGREEGREAQVVSAALGGAQHGQGRGAEANRGAGESWPGRGGDWKQTGQEVEERGRVAHDTGSDLAAQGLSSP
ncbi:hypothetical protein FOA52_015966 [Chlamydomonas sp. UWO 241]|nr:hypothetical protein FOA52_015966 [Chlamydomonas sp. UWO 241]